MELLSGSTELLSHLLKLELEWAKLFVGSAVLNNRLEAVDLNISSPNIHFLSECRPSPLGRQTWESGCNPTSLDIGLFLETFIRRLHIC